MALNLTLRVARQEDYDFLLKLRNSSMNEHIQSAGLTPTQEFHRERIGYRYDAAKIIVLDAASIGLLKLVKEQKRWTLVQIQLMPEYQGKGIGTNLIKALIKEASIHGASLFLSVYKSNPARHLYQRLGFVTFEETEMAIEMKWSPNSLLDEIYASD